MIGSGISSAKYPFFVDNCFCKLPTPHVEIQKCKRSFDFREQYVLCT